MSHNETGNNIDTIAAEVYGALVLRANWEAPRLIQLEQERIETGQNPAAEASNGLWTNGS